MGDRGGKTDMERVGLFQEMAYVSIGDKYRSTASNAFNESAGKGKQLLPGGSKMRSDTQHGYFTDKFSRVFDGESYTDPVRLRRLYRIEQSKKNLGKPFLPASGEKKPCGLGSYYGTLSGPYASFSPIGKEVKLAREKGKNMLTNPGKIGTGYGYANVTLSPYPAHSADPYNIAMEKMKKTMDVHKASLKGGVFRLNMFPQEFFDINPYRTDKAMPAIKKSASSKFKDLKPFKPSSPAKMSGGCKMGTFDPYPTHSAEPYTNKITRAVTIVNKTGKIFVPPPGPKSTPVNSIVNQNVIRSINVTNYRAMTVA